MQALGGVLVRETGQAVEVPATAKVVNKIDIDRDRTLNVSEDLDLETQCPLTKLPFRELIKRCWLQNLPYILYQLVYVNGKVAEIKYADAGAYYRRFKELPKPQAFDTLVFEKQNPHSFADLLKLKTDYLHPTTGVIRESVVIFEDILCANQQDATRVKNAPLCQYMTAVRYKIGNGLGVDRDNAFAFARLAARNGFLLARDFALEMDPHATVEGPTKSMLAQELFPEDKPVENVLLAFRALIRELPQPAEVVSFEIAMREKYTNDAEYKFEYSLGGNKYLCFKFEYTLTATVKTPDGIKVITRKHWAAFNPSYDSSSSTAPKDFEKCEKIARFVGRNWGMEFQAALVPSHEHHSKVKPHIDQLTLNDELFNTEFTYSLKGIMAVEQDRIFKFDHCNPERLQVVQVLDAIVNFPGGYKNDWKDVLSSAKFVRKTFGITVMYFPIRK